MQTAKHPTSHKKAFLAEGQLKRSLFEATLSNLNLDLPKIYQAVLGNDGMVRVENVPIFGENVRSTPYGDELVYSKDWLDTALKNDVELRASGYSMPLHFGHHEAGVVRERAGSVELSSVRLCMYIGKPLWTLFGTLVFKDQASYQKAKVDFPYRSVEISTGDRPNEVNSLALLSSEAPYFRFPNLTYRALADKGKAFFWSQPLMSEISQIKVESVGAEAPVVITTTTTPATIVATSTYTMSGTAPVVKTFDAEPSAEEKPAAETMDFGALLKRMAQLEAVVSKLAGVEPDTDYKADETEEPAKEGAHVPIVAASASIAALEGKLARQESELAQIRAERNGEKLFATLYPQLLPYKLTNLDAELKKRVQDGSAKEWAAGILTAPPRGVRYEAPREASPESPEVAAYAAYGHEAHTKAKELEQLYASVAKNHLIRKNPLAAFLASNMASSGLVKE